MLSSHPLSVCLSVPLSPDDPGTVHSQKQCPEFRETTRVQGGNIRLEETLPLLLCPAAHDPHPRQPGAHHLDPQGHELHHSKSSVHLPFISLFLFLNFSCFADDDGSKVNLLRFSDRHPRRSACAESQVDQKS